MINVDQTVTDFSIEIGGHALSESQNLAISELIFEERFEYTSKVEFTLKDYEGFDLKMSDLSADRPLKFSIGWRGDRQQIFDGLIVKIIPRFEHNNGASLRVVAYDHSFQLKRKLWPQEIYAVANMRQVVERSLQKYRRSPFDLIPVIVDGDAKLQDWQLNFGQQGFRPENKSDYEFLTDIAKRNGYALVVGSFHFVGQVTSGNTTIDPTDNGHVAYFVPRDFFSEQQGAPHYTFFYRPTRIDEVTADGMVLYDFKPMNRMLDQADKVEVRAWRSVSPSGVKRGIGSVDEIRGQRNYTTMKVSTNREEVITIFGEVCDTDNAATQMARAEMERRARKFVEGQCVVKGWPLIRLGQKHKIVVRAMGDIGRAFSMDYLLTGVEHRWDARTGFMTSFDIESKGLAD